MKSKTRIAIGVAIGAVAIVTAAVVGGGLAQAASADGPESENEVPITGPALEQASAAALAHTGEGAVTGTEVGDEESYYEVEVTLDDGTEVDVQLDKKFQVVEASADSGTED